MRNKIDIIKKLKFLIGTLFNIGSALLVFDYIRSSENKRREISNNVAPINEIQVDNSQVNILRNIISGSIAGATVAYTTFPLEARKKWKQSGQRDNFNWYRGSSVFAFNIIPTTAIQFMTNRLLSSFLPINHSFTYDITASIISGFSGAITATFVENTIIRQQILQKGPFDSIKEMLNISVLRPWKTYPYIAVRDGIFTFSMFWALPETSRWCKSEAPQYEVLAPIAISLLGAGLSHPIDTVATRMQMTHNKESAIRFISSLIKNDGYKGLYKGFTHRFALFSLFSNALPVVNQWMDKKIEEVFFPEKQAHNRRK